MMMLSKNFTKPLTKIRTPHIFQGLKIFSELHPVNCCFCADQRDQSVEFLCWSLKTAEKLWHLRVFHMMQLYPMVVEANFSY